MASSPYSLIEPISERIEPFKRKSKIHYGFQGYFTTQPFNVVAAYIDHFSNPKDLVIDPFCGSGVTAVESLKLGRRSFVSDLNPFAVFITKAKCEYADVIKLYSMFEKIIKSVEKECLEVEGLKEDELLNLDIPYWYPKNVLLPSSADVKYLDEIFTKKQLYQLSLIKNKIDSIKDSPEKNVLNIIFCGALKANKCYDLPDDGRGISGGQFTIFSTGRYRIPKKMVDISAFELFSSRGLRIIDAKKETNKYITPDSVKGFNAKICSATDLRKYLKDKSVDYIYTDPPYGGHITYLDLSIVYNEWLQLSVTKEMKEQEAIEGGQLKNSRTKYFDLLRGSFEEMARVLKPERWCSLVFHHKEPSLWTNIVETAREVGFEFKNTVVQDTKLPSWHKIDVPQSVMSHQMIINFLRKDSPSFITINKDLTLDKLIYDVAEREIIKRHGATLEEIINALIPELFIYNVGHDASNTKTDYIKSILKKEFIYNTATHVYQIDYEKNKTIGSYIPMQQKIKMYLRSFMKSKGKAKFDDIIATILPKLINGRTPDKQEILNELIQLAKFDGTDWVFVEREFQQELNFSTDYDINQSIPELSEHDQIIYRLSVLGITYNLLPKVGNKEKRDNRELKEINQIENLKYPSLKPKQLSYINNIDCLWIAPDKKTPIFAFEVEHSTTIDTAFERFIHLMKVDNDISQFRRLVLVISKKNRKQFDTKIKQSSFIGSPHFINNKVRYIFEETLIDNFEMLKAEGDFIKFEGLLSSPDLG